MVNIYAFFVFISEQTATCATYSINWLVFITKMKNVYSTVRTESLYKTDYVSSSKVKIRSVFELDVCLTLRHQYNDVSNQRDATTCSFINLFNSVLHVSGDKFAHPEELFFDCIYSFWYNALYIQSKRAPEDGRICRPKKVGLMYFMFMVPCIIIYSTK